MQYIANDGKLIDSATERDDIEFYNVDLPPFSIHGVKKIDGLYRRMPEQIAKSVSDGVHVLHAHTSGGRVRFVTDSPFIVVRSVLPKRADNSGNMAFTGVSGFDLYSNTEFVANFSIQEDRFNVDGFAELPGDINRVVTLNMPLYNKVSDVYIGLKAGSLLLPAPDYTVSTPVVFYGSSVTQGASASRPGLIYQSKLSRRFDFDFINLGFSGSAKAEEEMAEYIADLDMSIFVYDYDHNANSTPHYAETHEPMFKKIRAAHPDLPILLLTKPNYTLSCVITDRQQVAQRTYDNAMAAGDKNVYYIPGNKLVRDEVFCDERIDRAHPSDLGFHEMAKAMETTFMKMLSDIKLRRYLNSNNN